MILELFFFLKYCLSPKNKMNSEFFTSLKYGRTRIVGKADFTHKPHLFIRTKCRVVS